VIYPTSQKEHVPVTPRERLVFKTERLKIERMRCSMLGNLNPPVNWDLWFGNVHRWCDFFSNYITYVEN